jgi:hypothetical protein
MRVKVQKPGFKEGARSERGENGFGAHPLTLWRVAGRAEVKTNNLPRRYSQPSTCVLS